LRLAAVEAAEADALARGDVGDWPIAPGWPHDDTVSGLSFARSGGLQYVIVDDEGRIAGECGTKAPPRDGIVEIGYGLAAPRRGRGRGGRAVTELIALLQAREDVRAVEAEVHITNLASRSIVERLEFVTDGQPAQGFLRYRLIVAS
jgi:RimJ/RimL family protein N-acetyltransferase